MSEEKRLPKEQLDLLAAKIELAAVNSMLMKAEKELDALKHDIERHVAICAEQATELTALRSETRDAARYRFIKDDRRGRLVEALSLRDAENWDEHIDEAMHAESGERK